MDREIWRAGFTEDDIPAWHCGRCGRGTLQLVPKSLQHHQTAATLEALGSEDWEPDWDTSRFAAFFSCSRCKETSVCAGESRVKEDWDDEYGQVFGEEYVPQYFDPPPPMIGIPKALPENLRGLLRDAFALYWRDPSSALTKLGVFLETLLTQIGVPLSRKFKSGKMGRRTLHDRIEWLGDNGHRDASQHFLAMKFLRNEGGHEAESDRGDVLDALAVVEYALELLFDDGDSPDAIRRAILKARGSRKERRTTKKSLKPIKVSKPAKTPKAKLLTPAKLPKPPKALS